MEKNNPGDMSLEEIIKEMSLLGQPAHRARQIFRWMNNKNVSNFEDMTNLPKQLIDELKKKFILTTLKSVEHLVSGDGAEKFLWELADGKYIETVLIHSKKRVTVCLSTQVGCRFKCPFCASGAKGFTRDLTAGEIVKQVLTVQENSGKRVTNIVFMGMGEPLDNYDNLEKSLFILNDPDGAGIGARKITVSTCGIIPGILRLKDAGIQVELSVSLHALDDKLRDELVPANRKYPVKKLWAACREYYKQTGRIITFEYTLIPGKNDSAAQAEKLADAVKRLKGKVNLIPCNVFDGKEHSEKDRTKLLEFKNILYARGVTATIRRSKGEEIMAACGQLAAKRVNSDR